ncbi:MAG TPA: O-antigen ligase family protein [Candidatus Saccharimonadales bacterium]|nr:O-antigen ligase family protein [Candidatus Saccharimonadales bacterium]
MHTLRRIPYYGFFILLIYMPFHIFLAQWLSSFTGGVEVWKIAKDVVLFGLVLFTICLIFVERAGGRLFYWLLGGGVIYGLVHLGLWAVHPGIFSESAALGIVYNNRLWCFLLLGFGAALLNRDKFVFSSVIKIVIGVTSVVALLGVLQYFLPKDVLTHFGYGLERGARPAFFIDDNPALPRIMSTLREPNALGAYLLVPVSILTALVIKIRDSRRTLLVGLLLLHGLALFLTFSRSAWLGTALAVSIILWWGYKDKMRNVSKRYWPLVVLVPVLLVAGIFALRNTPFFQGYITHATVDETNDLDSNDYHAQLVREGLDGVIDQPQGHGPGTAGLASIRDPGGGQLTENYYVQIAYEVGVLGLLVFAAISVLVYYNLWCRKDWIGTVLIAGFWGYVVMNTLLHTWSNEAVASQWWLLAGAALAPIIVGRSVSTKKHGVS